MDNKERLERIGRLVADGLDPARTAEILGLVGLPHFPVEMLGELTLYSECLPKAGEYGYTEHQRFLHFLWDAFDRSPVCLNVAFAFPFRRLVAQALFKRCGRNFLCEEGVRFNFGQGLEIGDDVFLNRGCFLDSKGGIELGDRSALAEDVVIFTHAHSQADHPTRSYGKVTLGPYAIVYSGAMITKGVTIGAEAIVAARSVVTRDVEPGIMVGGSPAKPMRQRASEGRHGAELNHLWLWNGRFQEEA